MRGVTYLDLPGTALVLCVADRAVRFDDHRPATISFAQSSHPAIIFGEQGLAVAHEEDLAVDGDSVDLAPCVHLRKREKQVSISEREHVWFTCLQPMHRWMRSQQPGQHLSLGFFGGCAELGGCGGPDTLA